MLVLVLAATLAQLGPLRAQEAGPEGPHYGAWELLADRAEAAVENPDMPESELEALRARVVDYRLQFLEAQAVNQDRIETLREQIAALGEPPGEDEVEAPEIAERRRELTERLAERQAPLLTADEAFRRADGIIGSIDRVLRERQADALLTLWPTPLNPANWWAGVNVLISSGLTLYGEVYNAWLDPARRSEMLADLPITLGALALAALLLLRGRGWMEQLTVRLLQSTAILRGRTVAAFALSLSQLLVPFLGLTLLRTAILSSRLTGPTIELLVDALVPAGMMVFFARWLSLQLFPPITDPGIPIRLPDEARRRGRVLALMLGLTAALRMIHEPLNAPDLQSDAANSALIYPLVLLAGFLLIRLSRVLKNHELPEAADETAAVPGFFDRMLQLVARVCVVLPVVAAVLGAVGYVTAATQIVFALAASLALAGVMIILHRLITAIYIAVLGDRHDGPSEALVPALAGMVLAIVAIPILAVIWGVRETELFEIWVRFREGFALGETRVAPGNILSFILVFVIGFLVTRALQGALSASVLPKTTMERGAQKAITSGVGYVGIVIAALVAFSTAGIDLSGLAIVAGALSVGIGFGLQNIVSNFVSGVILLIERPVSEGDWVEVGPVMGTVSRISVRSTVIETFDRSEVIVPNADLISNAVTNYTKSNTTGRVIIPVGVAYGTDTRRVERILREIIEAQPIVALTPPPSVLFLSFGADALEFEIRAILRDVNFLWSVKSDVNHEIARRFAEEGIEVPFAQRDIWLRNPEALGGKPAQSPPKAPLETGTPAQETSPSTELHFDEPPDGGGLEDE
ncbi:MAG: Small-conductance mechanosensitive channel [Rhodobacteraceae bacterium HLUCCA12]|nr:MAG: Small-conductance mechanosensitive channel [Rhodobacteraceae bacterium HLUCCA12]